MGEPKREKSEIIANRRWFRISCYFRRKRLVLASLSLISPVVDIINNGFKYDYISEFLRIAVEVTVFFESIKYAIALRKAIA